MKVASVRDVQHGLAEILARVEQGDEYEITRRGVVVARLVPVRKSEKKRPAWPDFDARLRAQFPEGGLPGASLDAILDEDRSGRE